MFDILENMSMVISNNLYIAPFVCLVAGLLSALLPCSLTQLPLLIAYLGGYESDNKKKSVKYSIFYAIGNSVVFIVLGLLSALIGKSFSILSKKIYIILGILMIIIFLHMINVINIIPKGSKKPTTDKKGSLGALILGIIGGFFTSPCTTPVLLAILSYVVSTQNTILGAIMLLFYSIGNGIVLVVVGSSLKIADKLSSSSKMLVVGKIINAILAILILALGLYLLYLGF